MKKIIIIFFILFLFSSISFAKKKTILHIPSYHAGYDWTDTCVKGIEQGLKNQYRIITYYMDTKRLSKNKHPETIKKTWKKYLEVKPDLVILGDDNALAYIGTKLAGKNIPVVFYGINANPRSYFKNNRIPSNMTGVLERPLFIPLLRYLLKIDPDIKKILFPLDDGSSSKAISKTSFYGKKIIKMIGVKAYMKHISTLKDWKKTIKKSNKNYDAIVISTFFTLKDEKKNIKNYKNVLKWTSQNTPIPLFGILAFQVSDDGAIGALVIIGEKHGMAAAKIADKILNGIPPSQIHPSMDNEGQLIFNKKQMKRFHIKLPEKIKRMTIFQ